MSASPALLADLVLVSHAAFVAFVTGGLALIAAGGARGWRWVRNPWFRAAHALSIAIVVAEAWLGAVCPLTTLEMAFRDRAGDSVYAGGFIAHWLHELLFYDAPAWAFIAAYTAFAAMVAAAWLAVRPRRFGSLSVLHAHVRGR